MEIWKLNLTFCQKLYKFKTFNITDKSEFYTVLFRELAKQIPGFGQKRPKNTTKCPNIFQPLIVCCA